MAKLVVLSEGLKGNTYEIKVERTTVGRVEDNAVQIPEPSVSSHHCEILLRGKDVVVRDLNSTNGTFINNEKVTESVLKPGQVLRLGQIEMRLENGAPPASARKPLDQTRAIGVKANEFEGGRTVTFDKNSPFAKKSNKTAVIFITIGAILAAVILIFVVIAFQRIQ
jgi:pSer/pThr/pTyr-binding forkhead associated (FHA) protein